jgi:3-hydroxybutyrate dehydrogenase
LRRKSAIVTGSTSGIGRCVADALAEAGMNIMLNGFGKETDIEVQRAELAARHGVKVLYSPADMNAPSEIQSMVKEALQGFGDVDVLVNNAGIQFVSPIDEFPDEKWEEIIRVDLLSCFYTIKGVLPAMKARGWGRIVNIASGHGLVASPNKSAYVAAKHGLVGLTKTVALEAAQFGVTANAICPGYLKTPMVEKQIRDIARARNLSEDEAARVILAAQPTKQFVTVEQIAAMVLFLCTDAAASVNGASLAMDGGWTAQ